MYQVLRRTVNIVIESCCFWFSFLLSMERDMRTSTALFVTPPICLRPMVLVAAGDESIHNTAAAIGQNSFHLISDAICTFRAEKAVGVCFGTEKTGKTDFCTISPPSTRGWGFIYRQESDTIASADVQ